MISWLYQSCSISLKWYLPDIAVSQLRSFEVRRSFQLEVKARIELWFFLKIRYLYRKNIRLPVSTFFPSQTQCLFFLSVYLRLVALFLISFSVWLQSFSFCFLFLRFRISCVNLRFSFIRGILFQNLHVATALSSIRCSFRVSLCLPRNRMKKEADQEWPQNI